MSQPVTEIGRELRFWSLYRRASLVSRILGYVMAYLVGWLLYGPVHIDWALIPRLAIFVLFGYLADLSARSWAQTHLDDVYL